MLKTQPICSKDDSVCFFMDGEIFGCEEAKEDLEQKGYKFYVNTDPEFCLHLYEEYGENFVEKLNGSFVIAIRDVKNKRLLIVNDRYGLHPLYYAKKGNKLLFASKVKEILEDEEFKREINDDAIAEFFTFGHLLGSKTFFRGIEVLPPSSILKWGDGGKMTIEQYWHFGYDETPPNHAEGYYVDGLVRLFKQAVERRMDGKGKHRIGVFLSGGMDSRAVLATIDNPVTTLTFAFPEIDNTPKIADKITEIKGRDYNYNHNHTHNILQVKEDFLVDFSEEVVYLTDGMLPLQHSLWISRLDEVKEQYCDTVLSGWGIEGTFKGQFLDKKIMSAKSDEELCNVLYSKYAIVNDDIIASLFAPAYYDAIKHRALLNLKKEIEGIKDNKHPANKNDVFVFLNRELRMMGLGAVYLRSRIEEREPFRDNDLIDFALKIPPELRYNNRIYFKFLKKLSPELFDVPVSPAGVKIDVPPLLYNLISLKNATIIKVICILREKSRGLIKIPLKTDYPDYGEWIRTNERLKKWVEDILLDERTLGRKYFDRGFIVRMVRNHMSYKKDYTQLIFLLLTFELWCRRFVEGG